MPSARRLLPALLAIGAAACAVAPAAQARPRLSAFPGCSALVTYAQAKAPRYTGFLPVVSPAPPVAVAPGAETAVPTTSPSTTAGDELASETNVQEQGVDEPDVVKVDRGRMVVITGGRLLTIQPGASEGAILGRLEIPGAQELLVDGLRALVFSTVWQPVGTPAAGATDVAPPGPVQRWATHTVLSEVDLSNPAKPAVRRTMTLLGSYVSARKVGHVVRVVVQSRPTAATSVAEAASPSAVSAAARAYVPITTIASRVTGRSYRRSVVPCRAIRRPDQYAGLGLTSVLTVDLRDGLQNVDRDAVLADADTVYASTGALWVATRRYVPSLASAEQLPDRPVTELHRFAAGDGGETTYSGSATVRGVVLNQFSLSEEAGVLRVATTNEPSWLAADDGEPSQSYVTTFGTGGGAAPRQIGQVGGLGKGERIYAVRFLGDIGYVVTFRQVDPLYAVDLSDPVAPKVAGELKISGVSSYLHPVGDGLLLGVGAAATDEGRRTGLQVSLFDVSRPAKPALKDRITYTGAGSGAEYDHRAFLYWKPLHLAVLPFSGQARTGSVGVTVGDQLSEAGWVSTGSQVQRSVIIGSRLYSLTGDALVASTLPALQPAWTLALPAPTGAGTGGGDVIPLATAAQAR